MQGNQTRQSRRYGRAQALHGSPSAASQGSSRDVRTANHHMRAADAVKASAALFTAVAIGDLTPSEAAELGKLIEAYVRALEATDFAARLDNLKRNR
jgi:hypothetical protein